MKMNIRNLSLLFKKCNGPQINGLKLVVMPCSLQSASAIPEVLQRLSVGYACLGALPHLRLEMTGATPVWDPHFIETLEGSFSAVSTPLIARNGAFCSIFRDLPDLHTFAPLKLEKFNILVSKFHDLFNHFSSKFAKCSTMFAQFHRFSNRL